jgi:hypothetical protein
MLYLFQEIAFMPGDEVEFGVILEDIAAGLMKLSRTTYKRVFTDRTT